MICIYIFRILKGWFPKPFLYQENFLRQCFAINDASEIDRSCSWYEKPHNVLPLERYSVLWELALLAPVPTESLFSDPPPFQLLSQCLTVYMSHWAHCHVVFIDAWFALHRVFLVLLCLPHAFRIGTWKGRVGSPSLTTFLGGYESAGKTKNRSRHLTIAVCLNLKVDL